jgi:hypothetical protein
VSESIQSLVASGKLKVVPLKSDTLTEQNALLELSGLDSGPQRREDKTWRMRSAW